MSNRNDSLMGMKRQVGWFVMLGIGALIMVLLIVSVRTNVFAKKFHLYVSPPSATSFYEGQPVKFQGFAIGTVVNIELLDEGDVRISLSLLERYRHMLHQGAVAQMIKEGFIGEQIVEVTAGIESRAIVESGDILIYEAETSIDQLLADIKPAVINANTLLKELAELATWMNDPEGDLRVALAGIRDISDGLKGKQIQQAVVSFSATLKQVEGLTKSIAKQSLVKHLSQSLASVKKVLDGIEPLAHALGRDGAKSIEETALLMRQVNVLSKSMNVVVSDLSELTPELPGLARESRETVEAIKTLLQSLEGSWLFGSSGARKIDDDVAAPPVLDMRP